MAAVGVPDESYAATTAGVLEPPGADSVVTILRNGTRDSVHVILEDANGIVQRSGTVPAADSTCWVTPLSDSLRYSAVVYVPPPGGPDSATAPWISNLQYTHTLRIHFIYDSASVPGWEPTGVSPDPGKGC